jgi:hypothetical protein
MDKERSSNILWLTGNLILLFWGMAGEQEFALPERLGTSANVETM